MKQDGLSWQPATLFRFIIADDHEMVRIGLRFLLEADGELKLIGEAVNGREALELCRRLQPDLALIDVQMPEMDGLEATRAIRQECPLTSVIIITAHDDPRYVRAAFEAGAAGFVLKGMPCSELRAVVQQVLSGESRFNMERAVCRPRQGACEPGAWALPQQERLTPRERDVLRLVAQGQTNREIAFRLSLSAGTVKSYVERVIAKLGAADRTQAAVRAVELGLLDNRATNG